MLLLRVYIKYVSSSSLQPAARPSGSTVACLCSPEPKIPFLLLRSLVLQPPLLPLLVNGMSVCLSVHLSVCLSVCMYVHMHVCMYVYIVSIILLSTECEYLAVGVFHLLGEFLSSFTAIFILISNLFFLAKNFSVRNPVQAHFLRSLE